MTESQAERTLVKSPPELWAELSDPASLACHLGELSGEIRITRLEPEKTVVWEGERASGMVELTQSGWGTKVTLTVKPQAEQEAVAESDPTAPGPEGDRGHVNRPPEATNSPQAGSSHDAASRPNAAASPGPTQRPREGRAMAFVLGTVPGPPAEGAPDRLSGPEAGLSAAPAPKHGLLARLFGWRRARVVAVDRDAPGPEQPERLAHDTALRGDGAAPEESEGPAHEPFDEPPPDAESDEPRRDAGDPEHTLAILGSVLDALGAAHHRPFSRS